MIESALGGREGRVTRTRQVDPSDTRQGRSKRRLISEDTPKLENYYKCVHGSSGDGVDAMQKFSARRMDLRRCSCRSSCALQVIACGRALDAVPRNADADCMQGRSLTAASMRGVRHGGSRATAGCCVCANARCDHELLACAQGHLGGFAS